MTGKVAKAPRCCVEHQAAFMVEKSVRIAAKLSGNADEVARIEAELARITAQSTVCPNVAPGGKR